MKRKKTLESDAVNHENKFCHPAHDDEQQQQQATAASSSSCSNSTRHSSRQVYTNTLVRRAAAHSITIIIDHVQVLCYETAYGICETSREEEK